MSMILMRILQFTLFFVAVGLLMGCASLYHKDAVSQDSAHVLVKLEKFPNIKNGKKPFVDKINGRYVSYGAFKNEYTLIPGEHTFRIEHCKKSGWPTSSDVSVMIKGSGNYNVIFEYVNDKNIKVEVEPCDIEHRALGNPADSL